MSKYKRTSGNASNRRTEIRKRVERARKSIFEDKECGNGIFHSYRDFNDTTFPSISADFRMLSVLHPKKYYFAVCISTLKADAFTQDSELAYSELNKIHGEFDMDIQWVKADKEDQKAHGHKWYWMKTDPKEETIFKQRMEIRESMERVMNSHPRTMNASMTIINEGYRPGSIGLMISVDEPIIDVSTIEKYIKIFREIGEPTNDGIVWRGPDVQITPSETALQEDAGD
jgi:hypothetical protein